MNSTDSIIQFTTFKSQKQPPTSISQKRCSENMQQIYRRTPMPKCDFNKVAFAIEIALWHGCSSVNLLHIFRKPFSKNIPGRLLLSILVICDDKLYIFSFVSFYAGPCFNVTLQFSLRFVFRKGCFQTCLARTLLKKNDQTA